MTLYIISAAFLLSLLSLSAAKVTPSKAFPQYTYHEHPIFAFPEFKTSRPRPVVMSRYYVNQGPNPRTIGSRFVPGAATYNLLGTDTEHCNGLDALILPQAFSSSGNSSDPFVEIHLKYDARVVVLLYGSAQILRALRDAAPETITGLSRFSKPVAIMNDKYREALEGISGDANKLPVVAVAVEKLYKADEVIRLPNPVAIKVDGKSVRKYNVLFARPIPGQLEPFPYPGLPSASAVQQIVPGASVTQPEPNQRCPDWLHDIHVVANQDMETAERFDEPAFFKTWHEIIDPVYWCYFGHGHGSYPGRFRPPFGYTAHKTPDEKAESGRQDESHRGFKIFAFALPGDKQVVVATLHAHLSEARRFNTRHHTLMVAVFDADGTRWTKKLELRMKYDTGARQFQRKRSGLHDLTEADKKLSEEIEVLGERRGRRFNIFNPTLNAGADGVSERVYEQWKGPLNTCSGVVEKTRFNQGFNFDFRDPATGLHDLSGDTKDSNMPYREGNGASVNIILVINSSGMKVARDLCKFDESVAEFETGSDGLFYTDPFFSKVEAGPGDHAVRQFWSEEAEEVNIPGGRIVAADHWFGHMVYAQSHVDMGSRFMNIEGAVDRTLN